MADFDDSLATMVQMMRDVHIKDDVHDILGPASKVLQTWGDVNTYMEGQAKLLRSSVVAEVKDKLHREYMVKKQQQSSMKTLEEAQVGPNVGAEAYNTENEAPNLRNDDNNSIRTISTIEVADLDFYISIALILKAVKPECVEMATEFIVSQVAAHNAGFAAETKGNDKGKGKATEGLGSPSLKTAVQASSSGKQNATSAIIAQGTTRVTAAQPGPFPFREYRTRQDRTDHGAATRRQYLDPHLNAWNQS